MVRFAEPYSVVGHLLPFQALDLKQRPRVQGDSAACAEASDLLDDAPCERCAGPWETSHANSLSMHRCAIKEVSIAVEKLFIED